MKHPTKQQMQTVIDNLYAVLPLTFEDENHLDMWETGVDIDHQCGTVHCFAGWYAASARLRNRIKKGGINWVRGETLMSKDLGIRGLGSLEKWATENPIIWGNEHGDKIFFDEFAFMGNSRPNGAKSLSDIINHLEEVKMRLPK